jgi:hypothetical protein
MFLRLVADGRRPAAGGVGAAAGLPTFHLARDRQVVARCRMRRLTLSCASFWEDENTEFFFLLITKSGERPSIGWLMQPPPDLESVGPMAECEARARLSSFALSEAEIDDEIARARTFKTTMSASFFDSASRFLRERAS